VSDRPAVLGGYYTKVEYLTKLAVARVTVEMPLELWEANQVVLGVPPSLDGAKKYVAITRISEDAFKKWAGACAPVENGSALAHDPLPEPQDAEGKAQDKPRTPFRDLPRSRQAAIKLQDEGFQIWLAETYPKIWDRHYIDGKCLSPEAADLTLKEVLGITSKKQLDFPNSTHGENWDRLLASFDYRGRA